MSTAPYTQEHTYISVSTPLGPDKLLLRSLHGEESISGLFRFTVEMVSEESNLDFDAIVGEGATVSLTLSGGAKRYINGIIARFIQAGSGPRFTIYQAELRPWLWLLTLTKDCRIFQNQSVPDIIQKVFSDLAFTDYRNALTGTYQPREYCVQYQESAFAFVSRLMEDEGIFYFFEHEDGKHTLVLADDMSVHQPCSGGETARYGARRSGQAWVLDDVVTNIALEQQVVTGKYALDDFNFETPQTDLKVETEDSSGGEQRIYEYPGGFTQKDAGDDKASRRIEMHLLRRTALRGEGALRAFTPGYKFDLKDHPREDLNASYVLGKVWHHAAPDHYGNSFEAFPDSVPFRPPHQTPRPFIGGSQTALVVGKSGEEIWTDKYGRIKVQFHWDQEGNKDENSSCWIRVDQGWAGKQWGSIFLPRIGQEVVVSFLEGDPDRPLVVGAVYNSEQKVPYTLPSEQTKSTVKSRTSKGGGGFNEIRFEDKKGSEEIFIHAQKDMNTEVENDQTNTIKKNRTTTIEEADETLIVDKGNRIVKVNTGTETHEIKGTRDITVTGNETRTAKANLDQEVNGNYTLKVDGNLSIEVTGSVTIKSATSMVTEAGTSMTHKAGAAMKNQAGAAIENKAGAAIKNEAGAAIENKAGAAIMSKGATQILEAGLINLKGAIKIG